MAHRIVKQQNRSVGFIPGHTLSVYLYPDRVSIQVFYDAKPIHKFTTRFSITCHDEAIAFYEALAKMNNRLLLALCGLGSSAIAAVMWDAHELSRRMEREP